MENLFKKCNILLIDGTNDTNLSIYLLTGRIYIIRWFQLLYTAIDSLKKESWNGK
jgi:hypothetical protein